MPIHVGTKLYLPASLGIWGSEPASKPLAGVPPAPPASTAGFGLGKPAPYIFRAGQAQPDTWWALRAHPPALRAGEYMIPLNHVSV